MAPVVDAHQHFWNLDKVQYPWLTSEYGPIYRTFEADELAPQLEQTGVDITVLVQAADSYEETEYILGEAEKSDFVGGVVGWVPLLRPEEAAEAFRQVCVDEADVGADFPQQQQSDRRRDAEQTVARAQRQGPALARSRKGGGFDAHLD